MPPLGWTDPSTGPGAFISFTRWNPRRIVVPPELFGDKLGLPEQRLAREDKTRQTDRHDSHFQSLEALIQLSSAQHQRRVISRLPLIALPHFQVIVLLFFFCCLVIPILFL